MMTVPQIWVRAVVPLMEERGVYVPGNVPGMHQIFANINLRLWEGRDRNAG